MQQMKTKGEKSKDRILNTALDLFSKYGYAETSAQEIADRCGVSQTTVFYHFKNKKYLFEHVLQKVITNNRSYFAAGAQKVEEESEFSKLKFLLESNIDWAINFPKDAHVLLMLFNFASSDDDFKPLATNTINNGRALVFDSLVKIAKEEPPKSGLALDELAIVIQQYVNGVIFQMLSREDKDEVARIFKLTLDSYLRSLLYK